MPSDKLDYRPHEKNSSAGMIAWFLVLELRTLVSVLRTGEHQWDQPPTPRSAEDIAAEYERTADEMEQALERATEARWSESGRLFYNGKLMMERPIGEILWDFFFDAIHHRGQLTAYLRPMGGKVPSIYGPSGDSH